MTRDDIIRIAAECGMPVDIGSVIVSYRNLERFAAKVLEAWAQDHAKGAGDCTYESCDFVCAAIDCAEAIRDRGNKSNEAQDANG